MKMQASLAHNFTRLLRGMLGPLWQQPAVMPGYANRAQDNVDIFLSGRLRAGDIGFLDEDGYLFIIDRSKDLILSGGFNVYPRMVEEAIDMHEAVEEVAVIGVADDHRGEIVKAFVHLHEGAELSTGDLKVFLRDKLAPFEIPRQIEFRGPMPKTLIGKVDKRELTSTGKKSDVDKSPSVQEEGSET